MEVRFADIHAPSASTGAPTYAVKELRDKPAVYLGRSSDDHPVLLVESPQALVPPMDLSHLKVFYSSNCHLELESSARTLGMTAVELTSTDPPLVDLFLSTMAAVLDLGVKSVDDLIAAVRLLVELFREVNAPPRSAVVGLWGELLAISDASDPAVAVRAWHNSIDERFDFSKGDERVEVKTTVSDWRAHQFAHDQLRSAPDRTLVVSTLTTPAAGGTTIGDLRDRIIALVGHDPELVAKVLHQVASSLGREWARAVDQGFDEAIARSSRRLYLASDLPAMPDPPPPEVSQIKYRVDLTESPALTSSQITGDDLWHGFAALVGNREPTR